MDKSKENCCSTKSILRKSSLYGSSIHVTFDEKVIEEQNKNKAKHILINTLKTPLHFCDGQGNKLPYDKLQKRKSVDLESINKKFELEKQKLGLIDLEEKEDNEKVLAHKKLFNEKRKSLVFNEFNGINPFVRKS